MLVDCDFIVLVLAASLAHLCIFYCHVFCCILSAFQYSVGGSFVFDGYIIPCFVTSHAFFVRELSDHNCMDEHTDERTNKHNRSQ